VLSSFWRAGTNVMLQRGQFWGFFMCGEPVRAAYVVLLLLWWVWLQFESIRLRLGNARSFESARTVFVAAPAAAASNKSIGCVVEPLSFLY